ncbi:hypothetical protein KJ591_02335, partial [Patescibacteria group bacterium]|nr:hypothetical protein [Patescibacteria group bacterium]
LFGFIIPITAMAGDACTSAYTNHREIIEYYDSNNNSKIEYQEAKEAMEDLDVQASNLSSVQFMAVIRFMFYNCVIPSQENDPVSGTLSVNKTEFSVGETIELTITAQDDDGLEYLWAHYQGEWHKDSADGTSYTKTWTFSESKPGTYVYKGYIYGKEPGGLKETAWTEPKTIRVVVTATEEIVDCAKEYGEGYWCSSYYVLEKECQGEGKIINLPTGQVCQSGNNTYSYCGTCYEESYPDLIVTSAEISNNDGKLYYTVKNQGNALSPTSQSFFTVDSERGGIDNISSMAAGRSNTFYFDNWECGVVGQSYRIGICADWDHQIAESNEDNNCYNETLVCQGEQNDPVSGTLSVNKTEFNIGETIKLTMTGQDDNGLEYLWAYYQGAWHQDSADGISYTKTWTFSESKSGTYTYRGYVYGKDLDGNRERISTNSVTVTVAEKQTIVDCAKEYGEGYWCSSYSGWSTECRSQGKIVPLGNQFCYSGSTQQNYCVTCQQPEDNSTLTGSISVSKTQVSAGESFNLTVTAQDGDGVSMIKTLWDNEWHTSYCDKKTSCSKTYTLNESSVGDYYYYGYLFGTLPDGKTEYAWTSPKFVKVTVKGTTVKGADLIVSSVSVKPSSPNANNEISFDVIIKNIGDEKMPYVSGGIITKVSSGSMEGTGYRICDAMTKMLGIGESATIDCPIVQTLSSGTHSFTFLTDSSQRLSETNESNNEKIKTFSVASSGTIGNCTDSDGGADYYQYGNAKSSTYDVEGRIDCCKLYYSTNMGDSVAHIGPGGGACVTSGPYLYEAICENDIPYAMVYQCPNGCKDGVCVQQ